MQDLWTKAGLDAVETREIIVQRSFADFDEFWTANAMGPGLSALLAAMPSGDVDQLKARLRTRLIADSAGRITCDARANAAKGRLPR